ncbi:MAG TPA: hypothetical protein VGX94_01985 [Terriglobia bacterium]|nr:hypothetical protein [Terriglobia bacterium]
MSANRLCCKSERGYELARLAQITRRRVAGDDQAGRELARVIRAAERGMLRVIDRWAARRRRERGAA